SSVGRKYNTFAIGRVSGLRSLGDASGPYGTNSHSFTTVVNSPDVYIQNGVYTVFAIKTTGYGIVPLTMSSYSAGTITLVIPKWWSFRQFGQGANVTTATDLAAEVQAANMLFCAELTTTFQGPQFHVDGLHFENIDSVTRFFYGRGGSLNGLESTFKNI